MSKQRNPDYKAMAIKKTPNHRGLFWIFNRLGKPGLWLDHQLA